MSINDIKKQKKIRKEENNSRFRLKRREEKKLNLNLNAPTNEMTAQIQRGKTIAKKLEKHKYNQHQLDLN